MNDVQDILALWRDRLAAVSSNMNDLSASEATKRIRIKVRQAQYFGATKNQAERAVKLLSTLSDDYLLLANAVTAAGDAVRGVFLVGREARQERLAALLGPGAIERQNGAVPLASRSLLDSATSVERLSADELLERMEAEFSAARDDLEAIDSAEQATRAALDSLRHDYERLDALAGALGVSSDRPSFIELQGLENDPLGATAGIEAMQRALTTWSDLIVGAQKVKEEASRGIARAGAALDELRRWSDMADTEHQKVLALLGSNVAATLPASQVETVPMLNGWYESLNGSLQEGHWKAVTVGLSRFEEAVKEATELARKAFGVAQEKIGEVAELRGRFTALKAKEEAIGSQASKGLDTATLREEITRALAARPVDLSVVIDRMRHYQTLLSGYLH